MSQSDGSSVDNRLVEWAPGSTEPTMIAVLLLVQVPISIGWAVNCYRTAQERRPGWRVLHVLMWCWIVLAADALVNGLYSALLMQCPSPLKYMRPPILQGAGGDEVCLAMVFFVLGDLTSPLGGAMISTGSMTRFLLMVQTMAETATLRFIRVSTIVVLTALAAAVAANATLAEYNVAHAVNLDNPVSFAENFSKFTTTVLFTLGALLDISSNCLCARAIYKVLKESTKALSQDWLKSGSSEVRAIKARERRYLVFSAGMLLFNMSGVIAFAIVYSGDSLLGMPFAFQNLIFSSQLRIYANCAMVALSALSHAIADNRRAAAPWSMTGKARTTGVPPTTSSSGGQGVGGSASLLNKGGRRLSSSVATSSHVLTSLQSMSSPAHHSRAR